MKKIVKIIFTLFVCFAITACGENPSQLPHPVENSSQLPHPNEKSFRMNGSILTWDEVPNAIAYAVKIAGTSSITNSTQYNVALKINDDVIEDDKPISFVVQLMSIASPDSSYSNSTWSLEIEMHYNRDDTPSGIEIPSNSGDEFSSNEAPSDSGDTISDNETSPDSGNTTSGNEASPDSGNTTSSNGTSPDSGNVPHQIELWDTAAHVFYDATNKTLTFDFRGISDLKKTLNYPDRYSNGVLTVYPMELRREIETIHFKGSSTLIDDLCIKISNGNWNNNPTIILENISFKSSNTQSLIDIEPSVDFTIEYRGNNELSSYSSKDIPILHSNSKITFKAADDSSRFTLRTNKVTTSDKGSIGIEANEIIIDGGIFEITGSNGLYNGQIDGKNGGNGSSGIKANKTTIKSNAVVNITAGNGADGDEGVSGKKGSKGQERGNIFSNATNGGKGDQGGTGGKGGDGGDAIHGNLVFESSTCIVTLKGGDGGNGGQGGVGGTGGDGGDNMAAGGINGNGGQGGTGGTGGRGGNGGNAVSGTVTNQNSRSSFSGGNSGTGGNGGAAGLGGKKGKTDGGWASDGGVNGKDGKPGVSGVNGTPGKAITG